MMRMLKCVAAQARSGLSRRRLHSGSGGGSQAADYAVERRAPPPPLSDPYALVAKSTFMGFFVGGLVVIVKEYWKKEFLKMRRIDAKEREMDEIRRMRMEEREMDEQNQNHEEEAVKCGCVCGKRCCVRL